MDEKDYLEIVLNYTHNINACQDHGYFFPDILGTITITKANGFYNKNWEKINEQLFLEGRTEILQVINLKSLNILELKKILGYSYPTIYRYALALRKLKLINFIESKSKKGKREIILAINHDNVKIRNLIKDEQGIDLYINEQKKMSEQNLEKFKEWLNTEISRISKEPTIRKSTRKSSHRHR